LFSKQPILLVLVDFVMNMGCISNIPEVELCAYLLFCGT